MSKQPAVVREILDIATQMLDNILYPTRVDNGTDYYTCPLCFTHTYTTGHIGSESAAMERGSHAKDCPLPRLRRLISQIDGHHGCKECNGSPALWPHEPCPTFSKEH